MAQASQKVVRPADVVGPARGQQAQLDAEQQDQQKRQPEGRDAAGHGADPPDGAVGRRILPQRAEGPQQQRQPEGQQVGGHAEQQRVPVDAADHRHHVPLILEGDAEVAPERVLKPRAILHDDRSVQPEPVERVGALGFAEAFRALAVVGAQRVAGGKPREEKDRDGKQKERQHKSQRPPDRVFHRALHLFTLPRQI